MIDLVQKEFNRRSQTYKNNNYLQKEIASHLVSKIQNKPKKILDLGAGRGEVLSYIDWDYENFSAIEFAENMIKAHPKNEKTTLLELDFNKEFSSHLSPRDLVISSSSLQWAKDLRFTLEEIKKLSNNIAFAIFTDNTFNTIREITKTETFLRSANSIKKEVLDLFNAQSEVKKYTLEFNSKKELFDYIKKTGVSGGEKNLTYKQAKDLINNYPTLTLEAEVIFFW